jgi:hypothetical protein
MGNHVATDRFVEARQIALRHGERGVNDPLGMRNSDARDRGFHGAWIVHASYPELTSGAFQPLPASSIGGLQVEIPTCQVPLAHTACVVG